MNSISDGGNYQIHVYMIKEEPYNPNVMTYVRRENLSDGTFDVLRGGAISNPDWIVKTTKQLGINSFLYEMTEEQLERNAWDEAEVIPQEEW